MLTVKILHANLCSYRFMEVLKVIGKKLNECENRELHFYEDMKSRTFEMLRHEVILNQFQDLKAFNLRKHKTQSSLSIKYGKIKYCLLLLMCM